MSSHPVRKRTHSSAQSCGPSISSPSLIPLCRSSVPGWSSFDDSSFNIHALTGGMSNILYTCTLKSTNNSGDTTIHTEKRRRTETSRPHSPYPSLPSSADAQSIANPDGDADADADADADSSHSPSPSSSPSRVVIRLYGASADSYFSREYENYITRELAKRGIGPQIYHEFKGGRIEEFLEGATLHCHDLHDPIISITIAQRVAQFHAQTIPIPSDVSPVPIENGTPSPILLHNLESWYALACDTKMRDEFQQNRLDTLDITSQHFKQELIWLREYLHSLSSPIVFCHQDLQEGNILWSPHPSHGAPTPKDIPDTFYIEKHSKHPHHVNEKRMCHIIDFEYAAYNYRGFDLGNHFCEHYIDYRVPYSYHDWYESGGRFPGFAIHHRWFPSKLHMKRWLEAYAAEFRRLVPASTINTDVEVLYRESMAFMLASHMHWSLWGIIQAGTSAISFGYLDYAEQRLSEYRRLKQWLIDPDVHVHQRMMSYADTVILSIQQQRRQASQQRKQRARKRLVWITLGLTLVSGLFWTRKRWA